MKRAILTTIGSVMNDVHSCELKPGCKYTIIYNVEFDAWSCQVKYPEEEK